MINIHPVLNKKILQVSIIAIIALLSIHLSMASEVATIHGAIYEWNSFDPLENVIVEVNSTPPQSMLAKYGIYSFNLAPGSYVISASYYSGTEMVAYTEEEITITDHGDYVLDLLLLPVYSDSLLDEHEFAELDEIASFSDADSSKGTSSLSSGMIMALILLILLFAGAYYLLRQRGSPSMTDCYSPAPADDLDPMQPADRWHELPDDLKQVIDILEKNGGRITQKDLRTKVRHSEAKVSLMVSDLEDRGIIRKFKKGRGNVIILEGSAQGQISGEPEPEEAGDTNQNV